MMRRAAAVILFRDSGDGLEVLLVKRSPKLRFLGGYHAFPGGVIDACDRSDPAECARRELFEETGVLLGECGESVSLERRRLVRRALLETDACADWAGLKSDAGRFSLAPVCRLKTPPFAPVQYDASFFSAAIPPGEEVEIVQGELVSGRFYRPAEALSAWREGEILIAPPVLVLLRMLVQHGPERFVEAARARELAISAGLLPAVRFTPAMVLAALKTDTLPPATTTNCYIVGGERLYVVDPAPTDRTEQERLLALLDRICDDGSRVEAVLLTHHHPDHVGAVETLQRRYGVPALGHAETLRRLPLGRSAALTDGDRIALGSAPDGRPDWSLEVIFTPGHAPGHLCFKEDRYDGLIVGDMVSTLSTIVIDPPEGHMATYLESLHRLRELKTETLFPAHGAPTPRGGAVFGHYLKHRQEREQKLLDELAGEARTEGELLQSVYADVTADVRKYAARSLLAGLEKLAEETKVRRVGSGWQLAESKLDG